MPDDLQRGLLRGLIYPIQFDQDPITGVNRVLEQVVRSRAMNAGAADYLAAVQAGLRSEEKLSELIPQGHTESVIRAYLAAIEKRLENEPTVQA
jgi:hypothetical protein